MDYERENAKEWQNPAFRPDPGTSSSDGSDDDDNEYHENAGDAGYPNALTLVDTNEVQENDDLGWTQVNRHKKPPPKQIPKPAPKSTPNQPANVLSGPRPSAPAPVRKIPPKLPAKLPYKPPARFPATLPPTPPPVLTPIPPPPNPPTFPIRQRTLPPQKLRAFTFAHKNDNPARAAFRSQESNTSTFLLPRHCYAIEPDWKKMYDTLEEMGVRLGSFIRPPQSATDRNLLLWGNKEQVNATIQELQKWILQSEQLHFATHTTKSGAQFAKTGLLSQDKAKSLDRRMKRQATKQKFQKVPDNSLSFRFTGYFLWPVDEVRPEDLLGPSYEAFDPIRIDYDSYIVFDNQLSLFKILTNEDMAVQKAMDRIKGTMKEFVARNHPERVMHMVERPDPQLMRSQVMLMDGPALGRSAEKPKIPFLSGESLGPAQMIQWKNEIKVAEEYQFAHLRHTISKVIKRLHLYRGRIQMRVLLGTFALTTFRRWPEGVNSISFEKFLNDMDQSATKGLMIKE